MKTLQESLFDNDLTTRDIRFGDLYEFESWAGANGNDEVIACDALAEYFISPSDTFNKYLKYKRGSFSKYLNYEITDQPIFGDVHKNDSEEDLFEYLKRSKFYTASMGAYLPILFALTWIILSSLWDKQMIKNIEEYLKASFRPWLTERMLSVCVAPVGKIGDRRVLLVIEFKSHDDEVKADTVFWAVFNKK